MVGIFDGVVLGKSEGFTEGLVLGVKLGKILGRPDGVLLRIFDGRLDETKLGKGEGA